MSKGYSLVECWVCSKSHVSYVIDNKYHWVMPCILGASIAIGTHVGYV